MSADLTRIEKQVTSLLNANTRSTAGVPVYSTAVGDKARAIEEIAETCLQAALSTARAICETDSHPWRVSFITDTAVAHGDPLPFHYGDIAPPTITPFSGASFTLPGVRKSYDRIEAYRRNLFYLYGNVNHNLSSGGQASDLAGFYDVVNGIFYFTGYSATIPLATFTRTNVLSLLDEGAEPVIVKVALANSKKEGDVSDGIFSTWTQEAMAELTAIRSGGTAFQPIDTALQQRGDQVA